MGNIGSLPVLWGCHGFVEERDNPQRNTANCFDRSGFTFLIRYYKQRFERKLITSWKLSGLLYHLINSYAIHCRETSWLLRKRQTLLLHLYLKCLRFIVPKSDLCYNITYTKRRAFMWCRAYSQIPAMKQNGFFLEKLWNFRTFLKTLKTAIFLCKRWSHCDLSICFTRTLKNCNFISSAICHKEIARDMHAHLCIQLLASLRSIRTFLSVHALTKKSQITWQKSSKWDGQKNWTLIDSRKIKKAYPTRQTY